MYRKSEIGRIVHARTAPEIPTIVILLINCVLALGSAHVAVGFDSQTELCKGLGCLSLFVFLFAVVCPPQAPYF